MYRRSGRPWRVVLQLALPAVTLFVASAAAEVYRWVDDDGTVHFSDQAVPGAVPVEPEPLSAVPFDVPPQPAADDAGGAARQEQPPAIDYRISIVNLRDDDVVWNNARELELQLAVAPRLAVERGHRVEVFIDGVRRGPARSDTRLVLSDIDRGTHSLMARIVDADGRVLAESERLTIHHRQHSVATPG